MRVAMYFTTQLSALSALILSLTVVVSKPLNQFKPRLQTDICASLDDVLAISGVTFGKVTTCTCVSGISNLLSSGNAVVDAAVNIYGTQTVTKSLNELILSSVSNEQCQYAEYSEPVCEIGNPCGFKCIDGFAPSPSTGQPTSCVCPSPNTICNGQCGEYSACFSGVPSYPKSKRDLSECDPGWKLCQIPGREVRECVDVMNDLWSCGGCEVPSFEDELVGVDCTAVPNVGGVSCQEGVCQVASCMSGFQLNDDKTSCYVMNATMSSHNSLFVQNGKSPF